VGYPRSPWDSFARLIGGSEGIRRTALAKALMRSLVGMSDFADSSGAQSCDQAGQRREHVGGVAPKFMAKLRGVPAGGGSADDGTACGVFSQPGELACADPKDCEQFPHGTEVPLGPVPTADGPRRRRVFVSSQDRSVAMPAGDRPVTWTLASDAGSCPAHRRSWIAAQSGARSGSWVILVRSAVTAPHAGCRG